MINLPDELKTCESWYLADSVPTIPNELQNQYCARRDIFAARLHRFFSELQSAGLTDDQAGLLTAATGELGNNSFDHNLGHWIDHPGCMFSFSKTDRLWVWIADRGRGIKASLSQTLADISDDKEAITTAFTKKISGRAPEKRGNGLKFVSSIISDDANRGLYAASGSSHLKIGNFPDQALTPKIQLDREIGGTIVILSWEIK